MKTFFDGTKYICLDDTLRKFVFRLLKITLLVDGKDMVDLDLSTSNKDILNMPPNCQFSLLIGVNGVGKSTILRGIIDFFIDFSEYYQSANGLAARSYTKYYKSHIQVVGVKYSADGEIYDIWKNDNESKYFINDSDVVIHNIPFPHIVASCFGVFDKFPIKNTFSSSTRKNRYNSPLYTYVGARASSNIFSTVSSIFQMLYSILSLEKLETILKVKDILEYMGYEDRLTLVCRMWAREEFNTFSAFVSYLSSQNNPKTNSRRHWYIDNFFMKNRQDQKRLFEDYRKFRKMASNTRNEYKYDFEFNQQNVLSCKDEIRNLYQLRQLGLITSTDCYLYRKGQRVSCNDISSGELNMFCTVVGALSASEMDNTLLLIDEPEISQHPNWQMSIIDFLDKGLSECTCHLLIATHSHFLVSDLPRYRSSVTYLKFENDSLQTEKIKEETYGWSAEEVLLKVFKVPTTRNIYLAKIVGELLDGIAKGKTNRSSVSDKIHFLEEVSLNMSEVDPMKKIINTITKTYKYEN